MASPRHNGEERPARSGYIVAILAAALLHAGLFALVFIVLPQYMKAPPPPPSYTVKIVDNLPAGDLGTHLPRINRPHKAEAQEAKPKPEESKVEEHKTPPPPPESSDKNAIALNTIKGPTPTETPPPPATPVVTPEPTPEPTVAPTPKPKPQKTPKPKPTPKPAKNMKRPAIVIAKNEKVPSVDEQLAKLHQQLLKERAQATPDSNEDDNDMDEDTQETPTGPRGGGPVASNEATEGKGYGVGPGTGSAGILQDPEFLLYYNAVQEKIRKSWSFIGGSPDLTASVEFAINPDGSLAEIKVAESSKDPAFDDSVVRAIRSAAPFSPPPDKYKAAFGQGVQATFTLGELKKS